MKAILFAGLCSLFLSACGGAYLTQKDTPVSGVGSIWDGEQMERFKQAVVLGRVGYKGPSLALKDFASKGFHSIYYAPHGLLCDYPELFLLGKPRSNEMTILIVGSNTACDWLQNIKSRDYRDKAAGSSYYIPAGHAGFRRAVINLVEDNFFIDLLPGFVQDNQISDGSGQPVSVRLIGHSLGAAIAQSMTPAIDGITYQKDASGNYVAKKEPGWGFSLAEVFAFAPPLMVSVQYNENDWDYMHSNYGAKTFMIMRDDDLVTALYNAIRHKHDLPMRHYGQHIRITRDNQVIHEADANWGLDTCRQGRPHDIDTYDAALHGRTPNDEDGCDPE